MTHRFSVAPMMDWTDRHCRYFHRRLSRHALLYTEMVTTGALIHGDSKRFLRFDKSEHPVALQLGGSEPDALAECAEMGERAGYDEINLNCGCPSDRVQVGRFGACLMREPERVAECVSEMQKSVGIPVTVKTRIGIDDSEDYVFLRRFVETIADAGCETFVIHARKAWLKGLSPKENREIPPLNYEHVYRLKQDFPHLTVVINGGIRTLDECKTHLQHVDGVMLGREAYENPWLLAQVDAELFDEPNPLTTRAEALRALKPYIDRELAAGTTLHAITRHILGLYRGEAGGRGFRRVLSQQAFKPAANFNVVEAALLETAVLPLSEAA